MLRFSFVAVCDIITRLGKIVTERDSGCIIKKKESHSLIQKVLKFIHKS